jgi:hypothetical protein
MRNQFPCGPSQDVVQEEEKRGERERERKIQSGTKKKREVVLLDQLDSDCLRRGGAVELN